MSPRQTVVGTGLPKSDAFPESAKAAARGVISMGFDHVTTIEENSSVTTADDWGGQEPAAWTPKHEDVRCLGVTREQGREVIGGGDENVAVGMTRVLFPLGTDVNHMDRLTEVRSVDDDHVVFAGPLEITEPIFARETFLEAVVRSLS